jgi:hypothetical protein
MKSKQSRQSRQDRQEKLMIAVAVIAGVYSLRWRLTALTVKIGRKLKKIIYKQFKNKKL